MKITKIGHCCMVLEEGGVKLLIDPGVFTMGQESVMDVDAVLITHEHADHFHLESLKKMLANNPNARVITNRAVGALLGAAAITHEIVGDGERAMVGELSVEGFGTEHGKIYKDLPQVENTGYFVGEKFYFPGDSLHNPNKKVDVLALPVAGPWVKMSEAIDYAKEIHPRVAFPVHDGFKPDAVWQKWPADILPTLGIDCTIIPDGETREF